MPTALPTALLVVLVVLAVAGGLYVGYVAGQPRPELPEGQRPPRSLGQRARDAATQGAMGLWRWNRARKKKVRDDERRRDRS